MSELHDDIIKKYLNQECSDEELVAINTWLKESDENAKLLFRMEEIYQLGKFHRYDNSQRTALAEKRLYERLKQEINGKKKIAHLYQWLKYAAAAVAIVLVVGAGCLLYKYETAPQILTVEASQGAVKEIVLPDGSKVWLNDASILKYPCEFSGKERNVYLDGEAYFEVTKDLQKPFIVESEAMRVRVLGTTFNLKSHKHCQLAEASLIEGEIEVRGNNEEGQIILTQGQRAELNKHNGRMTVKQVNTKLDAVWHNDLIPFDKADIFVITQTLERFYNVKIILSPDMRSDKTYSGMVKKKSTIESVLTSLQNSIPFNYKITGNNIFISSSGE